MRKRLYFRNPVKNNVRKEEIDEIDEIEESLNLENNHNDHEDSKVYTKENNYGRNTSKQRNAAREKLKQRWVELKKQQNITLPGTKHGAYSFLKNEDIPEKKMVLFKFVNQERNKWIRSLGGKENLSTIQLSLLDEATKLLMFSTLINDYLVKDKTSEIMFKDNETGELKIHTALSRNYLSFTKTYISILKELNKMALVRGKKGVDSATMVQNLYKKGI